MAEREQDQKYDAIYKLLVIGDANVGKTTLLTRFCEDRFKSDFMSTVGIDYKTKIITMDNNKVKLQIWDTAGQERFRTLTNAYFRGAAGALLLYDITSRVSFVNVAGWMENVAQHASGSIKVTIVGHKCDADTDREVTTSEGEKMAQHYDCMFFETSAVTGHNVANVFIELAQEIRTLQASLSQTKNGRRNSPSKDLHVGRESQSRPKCSC